MNEAKTWQMLLVHILGPLLGGITAAPVFWLLSKGKKLMNNGSSVSIVGDTNQRGVHLPTETPLYKPGQGDDGHNQLEMVNK